MTPHITVTWPWIPQSAKNRRRIFNRGGRIVSLLSKDAEREQKQMAASVMEMAGSLGVTWAGANYVGVEIIVDERAKRTRVTVHDLGPQPAKGPRNTRRDVHGVIESVMDGLQGAAFDDDRQTRWVRCEYGAVD